MQFLWNLLPGARETRNQVIVGYAWILAVGLWVGVPEPAEGTPLRELADAVGPVGVGVALGFAAFLIGSLSDDLIGAFVGTRRAAAFSIERGDFTASGETGLRLLAGGAGELLAAARRRLTRAEVATERQQETHPQRNIEADVNALDIIKAMPDSVRAELERLEASIDRTSAEISGASSDLGVKFIAAGRS